MIKPAFTISNCDTDTVVMIFHKKLLIREIKALVGSKPLKIDMEGATAWVSGSSKNKQKNPAMMAILTESADVFGDSLIIKDEKG